MHVYRGEVEFMTRQEWAAELKILVDECSTQEKRIYAREPDPQNQAEAANAWAKIDQVYGKGTMNRSQTQPSQLVFNRLSGDFRVLRLLTPKEGSNHPYNIIPVEEGEVIPGSADAKALVESYKEMNTRMQRSKKKWAHAFRSKINSYVYRKGNGNDAQTWPLIRKVVLHGPWACLSTGACLVDLPGVRDANAARAKVSEHYLQHCNQIWVVAPIKRAVDDGTAKELLGEQFKRRLLMDGQYGNVSFICTQTDDCEATEIMRDHADVAQKVPGRWERMNKISSKISDLEKEISDLAQAEDDLKRDWEEADQMKQYKEEHLEELHEDIGATNDDEIEIQVDVEELERARQDLDETKVAAGNALRQLRDWRDTNQIRIDQMHVLCQLQQRQLKTLCATVRNEYSKKCLQDDFKAGLKDLYRRGDVEDEEDGNAPPETVLPEDFEMDVYCISANDYLKIQGIKPTIDGLPNTFDLADDTQIPNLRMFVHETTARHCASFAKSFVNNASDMLDRVKLLAVDAANVPSGRSALQCMRFFKQEVTKIGDRIQPLTKDFTKKMEQKVTSSLEPALKTGAAKGIAAAMPICQSWGSKSRRTKQFRDPQHNGLYWGTYNATVRREGVFTSPSAGAIDMNQELADPMEKEFSTDWQRTMDNALRTHLVECETRVQSICSSINQAITSAFAKEGMDKERLSNMSNTANRSCANAVKAAFAAMRRLATDTQRNLNRSLLPLVKDRMKQSYTAALGAPRGAGVFNRMKHEIETTAQRNVLSMFDESGVELLKGIDGMVTRLVTLISESSQTISKHLEDVYSICWDDQSEKSRMIDPVMKQKVRACRDGLLPDLNKLCKDLDGAREIVGIQRECLDIDVMAVETLDNTIKRKLDEAKDKGEIVDLCDSDEDVETIIRRLPPANPFPNVKAEPNTDNHGITL